MDWTALFKTNHHFLKSTLSAEHDGRDDSTVAAPLSVFRRSDSPDFGSPACDDSSAAAAAAIAAARRTVSISRSGRYKSKSKQRVRLFNSLDFSTAADAASSAIPAAAAAASDDAAPSPPVAQESPVTSHDQQPDDRQDPPSEQPNVASEQPDSASTAVEEVVAEPVKTSPAESVVEDSPIATDQNYLSPPPPPSVDAFDFCMELSVAEVDESTDL